MRGALVGGLVGAVAAGVIMAASATPPTQGGISAEPMGTSIAKSPPAVATESASRLHRGNGTAPEGAPASSLRSGSGPTPAEAGWSPEGGEEGEGRRSGRQGGGRNGWAASSEPYGGDHPVGASATTRLFREGAFAPFDRSASASAAQEDNTPYDGKFTFARLRFDAQLRGSSFFRGGGDPPWHHDYPHAERNLMAIMAELTDLRPYMGGGNVFRAGDPELFRHPLLYVSEPGFWTQSDEEAAAIRAYLLKGGFMIFDDFSGYDWVNFEDEMRRVLPEARLIQMDGSEAVWDAFFRIDLKTMDLPSYRGAQPTFFGVFEDNDRTKRMMAVVNYNADIGDFWEYSATGWTPIDLTNEAFKLGVNYVVYALTH